MRSINLIVIHHSASPLSTTLADVDRWHRERGFDRVGYHFLIEADGVLRRGRPLDVVGAHAKGRNTGSIGICVAGDNTKFGSEWTPAQKVTLRSLVETLTTIYPDSDVRGHRDVMPPGYTECPGLNVRRLLNLDPDE
jgi:N-acetylmuramoyl-L-alanine amidase